MVSWCGQVQEGIWEVRKNDEGQPEKKSEERNYFIAQKYVGKMWEAVRHILKKWGKVCDCETR